MHIDPLTASLIAFAAGVLLLEVTREKRSSSKALSFFLIVVALLLSTYLAAYTSRDPEASGGQMFYMWVAYAIFAVFVRKKVSRSEEQASEDQRQDSEQ